MSKFETRGWGSAVAIHLRQGYGGQGAMADKAARGKVWAVNGEAAGASAIAERMELALRHYVFAHSSIFFIAA
ncbi:MAG: hypothetical protein ABSD58_05065 [Verrucomicrobiia bacterium]|jgi:hypothetical protein